MFLNDFYSLKVWLFCLTHYHTMPYFDALKMYKCGKHCEERRNCLKQAISPFLTMFSTLYVTYFQFQICCKMSSAICFNLDQFKMLTSGNGLNNYQEILVSKRNMDRGPLNYTFMANHKFLFILINAKKKLGQKQAYSATWTKNI